MPARWYCGVKGDLWECAPLQLRPVCQTRSLRQAAGAGGRSQHHETLRGPWAVPERVASDQRQCVVGPRCERSYLFGRDDADVIHGIGALAEFVPSRVEPLNLNLVSSVKRFQRPKPTCAMAGEFHVAGLAQVSSTEKPCGAKGQRARSSAFQHNFVVTDARYAQSCDGGECRPRATALAARPSSRSSPRRGESARSQGSLSRPGTWRAPSKMLQRTGSPQRGFSVVS